MTAAGVVSDLGMMAVSIGIIGALALIAIADWIRK